MYITTGAWQAVELKFKVDRKKYEEIVNSPDFNYGVNADQVYKYLENSLYGGNYDSDKTYCDYGTLSEYRVDEKNPNIGEFEITYMFTLNIKGNLTKYPITSEHFTPIEGYIEGINMSKFEKAMYNLLIGDSIIKDSISVTVYNHLCKFETTEELFDTYE